MSISTIGNPDLERRLLESTYEDWASVARRSAVKGPGSIARPQWEPVLQDEPCALSYEGDRSQQSAAQTLDVERKLFISPTADIRPGDRITVQRLGKCPEHYEVLGQPMVYATHQEVPLKAVSLS